MCEPRSDRRERLAKSEEVGGSGQDEATSQPSPTDPSEAPVPDGPPDFAKLTRTAALEAFGYSRGQNG